LSLNLIVYSVENFRLSWRLIVMEGPMYGRQRHVDVSFIAKISKILTASIFKTKSLRRAFCLYINTCLRQAGGYPGQYSRRLFPEHM